MNDQELLALAYKAAFYGADLAADKDMYRRWNPLTNDGDAFRLAVTLRLSISIDDRPAGVARVYVPDDRITAVDEPIKPDASAATRRAIVRAAAAIAG